MNNWFPTLGTRISSNSPEDTIYDPFCIAPRPHTRYGTGFGIGTTNIYGYPKRGGIYVLPHALGVEFDFLGLDRFGSLRSEQSELLPPDDEEAFCNKSAYYMIDIYCGFSDCKVVCLFSAPTWS